MALRLVMLLVDDESDDLSEKSELENFAGELCGATHFTMAHRVTTEPVDGEEETIIWMADMLAEMTEQLTED